MTYEEAKRILHPETTREAIAEIGFKGKETSQEAADEACLMACEALDKQIPEPPVALNQKGYKHFFCVVCDMRLVSEINGRSALGEKPASAPIADRRLIGRADNGEA